jgi:hypothetical protein
MPIDHVLIAVADARAATASLQRRHGLAAVEGGVHPGWGTGNWIVSLGSSYLELVFIDDPATAATSAFGRRAGAAIAAGGGPYAWCVAPADFERTAARLGLAVTPGSRRRPDGSVLAWRTAGLEVALEDPSRPFFIDWQIPRDVHPGRSTSPRRGEASMARLELSGDEAIVRTWLGVDDLPLVIRPGQPAITALVVQTAAGVRTLGASDWS